MLATAWMNHFNGDQFTTTLLLKRKKVNPSGVKEWLVAPSQSCKLFHAENRVAREVCFIHSTNGMGG